MGSPSISTSVATPNQCDDRCDSLNVTVTGYQEIAGNEYDVLCIDYKVQNLFDDGACDRTVKSFILYECSGSPKNDKNDMSGLIESCETTSGRAKSGKKFCTGNKKGITIKPKDENFDFQLCLRNVFDDGYNFVNKVKFKTKVGGIAKENFLCSADYLSGLPCFDVNKFNSGDYNDVGFNAPEVNNALIVDEAERNNELNTHSTMDSTVELSLISGLSVLFIFVLGVFGFCIYRKKKIGGRFTRNSMAIEFGTSNTIKHNVVVTRTSNIIEMAEQTNGNEAELSDSEAVILSSDQV